MYAFVVAAGAMALYLATAALRAPHPARVLAAVLWAAYAVYEYCVANGTLCDANCNIRVGLVLFLPLLAIAAYLGLQKEPRAGAVAIFYMICLGLAALPAAAFGYNAATVTAGLGGVIAAAYGIRSSIARRRA